MKISTPPLLKLFILLFISIGIGSSFQITSSFKVKTSLSSLSNNAKDIVVSRRRQSILQNLALLPFLVSNNKANALDITSADFAKKLKRIPVFALVDGNGIPFCTFQNGGVLGINNAIGYFFLSYEDANNVLQDAKLKTLEAKENDPNYNSYVATDWINAQVCTVPMEFVFKLMTNNHPKSKAVQNSVMFDTVYDVIPSLDDIQDAKMVQYSKSKMFNERGRVPLFYSSEFKVVGAEDQTKIPVFFTKADYINAFQKKFPEQTAVPKVMVMELNEVFDAITAKRTFDDSINLDLLPLLSFYPTSQALKDAKECVKNGATTYKFGEIVLVKGGGD